MSELYERISEVIDSLGLKKIAFADRINVSQAFVSQLCSGVKQPSDRTIADICREFNVNENWLRTGEGDMFLRRTRNEELAAFMGDLLRDAPDFRHRLITVLSRLTTQEWELLEQMADKLLAENEKEGQD